MMSPKHSVVRPQRIEENLSGELWSFIEALMMTLFLSREKTAGGTMWTHAMTSHTVAPQGASSAWHWEDKDVGRKNSRKTSRTASNVKQPFL